MFSFLSRILLFSGFAVALAQQAPPSIVAEGVPEVPRELVRKLLPYRNIRSAMFRSWHPLRREMLIATRLGNTSQIHLVKTPGGMRLTDPDQGEGELRRSLPGEGQYHGQRRLHKIADSTSVYLGKGMICKVTIFADDGKNESTLAKTVTSVGLTTSPMGGNVKSAVDRPAVT